jgi:phage baseplate assembly protein W
MSISIRVPFQETQQGGVFLTTKTTMEAIQTNLIALLTMKRGHRVMNSSLYSPLWDYIFEPWDDISSTRLRDDLIDKIAEYISEIEVTEVRFNFNERENLLEVKVFYKIIDLGGVGDSVSIIVPVEPGEDAENNISF